MFGSDCSARVEAMLTIVPRDARRCGAQCFAIRKAPVRFVPMRRFHSATKGVKQELYLDAYSWVTANDFLWPYSFVNVCKLLNVSPEVVRAEIFADASLNWLNYWTKRVGNVSRRVRASFARTFGGPNHSQGTEVKPVGFMYLNEYEKTVHPIY